jgi:hypothetical protein
MCPDIRDPGHDALSLETVSAPSNHPADKFGLRIIDHSLIKLCNFADLALPRRQR